MNHAKKNHLSLVVNLLLPLFFLILNGCAPATIGQLQKKEKTKQLQAGEILKLVESNTLFCKSYQEDIYYYFDQSGTLFGLETNNNSNTRHWHVSDSNELCIKMEWWWYGDLRCFQVYTDGAKYFLADSAGLIAYTADLFPGDHKNQYRDPSKTKRKSYRKSIRSGQSNSAARVKESPAAPSGPEPGLQPRREPIPDVPARELKSTVKWMARDCPGCNFANANLSKAELVAAKLQGANLAGADLNMANLRRADLQGANLSGADLSYANMPGADLRHADLTGARLKGANLIRADLTGAKLEGADLEGAHLDGVTGLIR